MHRIAGVNAYNRSMIWKLPMGEYNFGYEGVNTNTCLGGNNGELRI